jgi:hypothetical protein
MNETHNLNEKYFKILHIENSGNFSYQLVQPKGNPIILFSVSDLNNPIPLVSVHLGIQSYCGQNDKFKNRTKSIFTKRWQKSPVDCNFQGIFTKDNQEFEFVLTNLIVGDELLIINILKKDVKITGTDPDIEDHRLNRINAFWSLESCPIKSDKKDDCSLIFSTIKNEKGESSSTIKDDEKKGVGECQGTYYWISAIASLGGKNEKLFQKTKWSCVDYFVLKIPNPTMKSPAIIELYPREFMLGVESSGSNNVIENTTNYTHSVGDGISSQYHCITTNDNQVSVLQPPTEDDSDDDDDDEGDELPIIRLEDAEVVNYNKKCKNTEMDNSNDNNYIKIEKYCATSKKSSSSTSYNDRTSVLQSQTNDDDSDELPSIRLDCAEVVNNNRKYENTKTEKDGFAPRNRNLFLKYNNYDNDFKIRNGDAILASNNRKRGNPITESGGDWKRRKITKEEDYAPSCLYSERKIYNREGESTVNFSDEEKKKGNNNNDANDDPSKTRASRQSHDAGFARTSSGQCPDDGRFATTSWLRHDHDFSVTSKRSSDQTCGLRPHHTTSPKMLFDGNDNFVEMSFAGKVLSGRKIEETYNYTDTEYEYGLSSEPCKIGLSVFGGLKIQKSVDPNTIVESGKITIQDYVKGSAKEYSDQLVKIYQEKNCCICLEENPNIVFFHCGHQCLHQNCILPQLKTCPLCRMQIIANIKY